MAEPITAAIVGSAVAALAAGRALTRVLRHRSRAAPRLTAAARNAGLGEIEETPAGWRRGPILAGRFGQLEVYLQSRRPGLEHPRTRIVIGLGPGTEELSLSRENLQSSLLGREVETGDRKFDRDFHVQGPAALTLALLDAATRKRVASLLHGTIPGRAGAAVWASVVQGVLEVELWDNTPDADGARLASALKAALVVARRLTAPADIAGRLAENFRQEPEAGVRLRRLLTLIREYPEHPATRQALFTARKDRDDEVCLRAGLALGDEGLDTLHILAEDPASRDASAAGAIAALGDRLPAHKVKHILTQALRARRKETARACLALLGDPGRAGRVQPETLLLLGLQDADADVAQAAARALGQVGTIDAVEPLREHATTLLPTELRAAARQAIAEIQARLTGAEAGQLTLAGGEAGALSLAGESGGGLSLAEQPADREDVRRRRSQTEG
ncbi:MAG TPA: HEAT repeat domain-containing protein [Thermoanaerobaculia bacterium]|nr:HEAT repeat domain-containing protein [Thermoanaerobaculia bacterium]